MGSELFTAFGNTATENKAEALRVVPDGIHNGCWNNEEENMVEVDQIVRPNGTADEAKNG